ncbi:hypothetical protein GALL_158680 [mine drainage metagenome]|uniref:Uncharacterized protein n=1 Tax=mine drainage metagenome TaxID=410659 RepID=A0A1J5S1R0_9ZZZZ
MSGISPISATPYIRTPAQASSAQSAQGQAVASSALTAGAQSSQPATAQAAQAHAAKVVDPRDVDGDGGAVTSHEIALYNEKHPNAAGTAGATQAAGQANSAAAGTGRSVDIRA